MSGCFYTAVSLYVIGLLAVRDEIRTITENDVTYTVLLLLWPIVELLAVIYTTIFLEE